MSHLPTDFGPTVGRKMPMDVAASLINVGFLKMADLSQRAYVHRHPSCATNNATAVYDGRRYLGLVEPHGRRAHIHEVEIFERDWGLRTRVHGVTCEVSGLRPRALRKGDVS